MPVDVKTLELLAETIEKDASRGLALQNWTAKSIASIIRESIGAPVLWPSRSAGADKADELYRGSPDLRAAFNHGVKWAVERYGPSVEIKLRNPD